MDLSSKHKYSNISNSNISNISITNNKSNNINENIKVFIRIRPPLEREIIDLNNACYLNNNQQDENESFFNNVPFRSVIIPTDDNQSCNLIEYQGPDFDELKKQKQWIECPHLFQLHNFTFDYVFDMDSNQTDIYKKLGDPSIESVIQGFNSTIIAYGQTGTGKSFTMEGLSYLNNKVKDISNSNAYYNYNHGSLGIIPRCIENIFKYIESPSNNKSKFIVRASYLQIYNDSVSDLISTHNSNLLIREDKKKGVYVENLSEWIVRSPNDAYTLLKKGSLYRETSSTKMNDFSSRSHAVFTLVLEQSKTNTNENSNINSTFIGKLNLVDLAGSERISVTKSTGKQAEEGRKINKSLSALGCVIYSLSEKKGNHIPYRDSKLTRILEDSLGGNCKTFLIATVSPSEECFSETLSTLLFAKRAKNIKNKPVINQDKHKISLLKQYEDEIKKLKEDLHNKNELLINIENNHNNEFKNINSSNKININNSSSSINDKINILKQQNEKAIHDKDMALKLLEKASSKYLQEKEEKANLEKILSNFNSHVLYGGEKVEDTPEFKSALKEKQNILIKEFDIKLKEIEKEKYILQEDNNQIQKYKDLLNKQRDIMITLTNKLNERDEIIEGLHNQLDEIMDKYNYLKRQELNKAKEVNNYIDNNTIYNTNLNNSLGLRKLSKFINKSKENENKSEYFVKNNNKESLKYNLNYEVKCNLDYINENNQTNQNAKLLNLPKNKDTDFNCVNSNNITENLNTKNELHNNNYLESNNQRNINTYYKKKVRDNLCVNKDYNAKSSININKNSIDYNYENKYSQNKLITNMNISENPNNNIRNIHYDKNENNYTIKINENNNNGNNKNSVSHYLDKFTNKY